MKKVLSLLLAMVMVVGLTGCFDKDADDTPPTPSAQENTNKGTDAGKVEDTWDQQDVANKYSEYQLHVDITSTDGSGNVYAVKTQMYKKGDKSLYIIEEMTGPEVLPFKPTQNLLVGSDLYTNIEMDGKSMWFKAPNVQQQSADMFDLEDMQESLINSDEVEKTEEEEIEGEQMTCYYMKGTSGKACMKDGIFAYGEDMDPTSGMKSVIKVTDYSKNVDDSVFKVPSDDEVKDMSEFMQMMMAAQAGTGEEGGIALGDLEWNLPEDVEGTVE